MGVLEKLRINSETDEEFNSDSFPEYGTESMDDSVQEPDPNWDPEPGQAPSRTASRTKAKLAQVREPGPRITKKMRDDAQNEIQSIVEVLALAWGWQAPPCGEALEAAAPGFAEKATRIIARNPRWLQRVRDGGLIADLVACAGTLAPVAKVAVAHYSQPKEDTSGVVEFDPARFPAYDGTGFSRAG